MRQVVRTMQLKTRTQLHLNFCLLRKRHTPFPGCFVDVHVTGPGGIWFLWLPSFKTSTSSLVFPYLRLCCCCYCCCWPVSSILLISLQSERYCCYCPLQVHSTERWSRNVYFSLTIKVNKRKPTTKANTDFSTSLGVTSDFLFSSSALSVLEF